MVERTWRKLNVKTLPEGLFHSSWASYHPPWNTLFFHAVVLPLQVFQSHRHEAESMKRGTWWGVTVCFIPKGKKVWRQNRVWVFFLSLCCPLLPRVQAAWSQHPYEIWDLVVILSFWKSTETRKQATAFESGVWNEINIRQYIPVFTEKILAYSSSVSLFYCHMRKMHTTYGLLRDLNC